MCVILTCPDCGERHADSWYGLSDLGGKLASQRAMFHKCHTVAVRELAYAIRSAQDNEAPGTPNLRGRPRVGA